MENKKLNLELSFLFFLLSIILFFVSMWLDFRGDHVFGITLLAIGLSFISWGYLAKYSEINKKNFILFAKNLILPYLAGSIVVFALYRFGPTHKPGDLLAWAALQIILFSYFLKIQRNIHYSKIN